MLNSQPIVRVSAAAPLRTYKVRVVGQGAGAVHKAMGKISANATRAKQDVRLRKSRFFTKPTLERQAAADAKLWWRARKDVKGILQNALKDGNLRLPPYVQG